MRYIKSTILFCGLVWLCCSSTQLFGSQVVTSGYICCFTPSNLFAASAYNLSGTDSVSGTGFDVTGSFSNPTGSGWGFGNCYTCQPGTLLPVGGSDGGSDMDGGTATIGSNYFPFVAWYDNNIQTLSSDLYVSAPPILLTGPGTFYGPFSFHANMCGTITGSETSCVVDLPSLIGNGIVTVEVIPSVDINGNPALMVSKAGYTFTPEPASWLLFGSGALGLAGALRRKLRL